MGLAGVFEATERPFMLRGLIFSGALFSTRSVGSFFGSFFRPYNVFNNFSASFFGSVRFVFGTRPFIYNNFSGSFFKKGILFYFFSQEPAKNAPFGTAVSASQRCGVCLPLAPKPRGG